MNEIVKMGANFEYGTSIFQIRSLRFYMHHLASFLFTANRNLVAGQSTFTYSIKFVI